MAEAFQPRFVDLVRNITTTVGKGNFVLGPAATGFASMSAALEPGESFYYSAIGIERPGEREVGRGTLQADGTVSRDPIDGVLRHFTSGNKTIALIAAAEWFNLVQAGGGSGAIGESSASGVAADGTSDDRDALSASDVSAAGEDKILVVRRGVHYVAADLTFASQVRFVRGAQLKPAAGVNIHFAAGYVADDWAHCFDIGAAGSNVTGDRAPMGHVTPQHFGADPTDPLTDDRPAIEAATEYATLDAIRDEYASGFPVKFPYPGDGNYYRTATRPIYVARTTRWFSETGAYGRTTPSTEVRGSDGLDAVAFAFAPGGLSAPAEYETVNDPGDPVPGIGKAYGAYKSHFENLAFLPESGANVRQGFVHNAICHLRHCAALEFSECGFKGVGAASGGIDNAFDHPGEANGGGIAYDGSAPVKGNVNLSSYEHCIAANNGLHGFVAHGPVAGTIRYFNCDAAGNLGAGFLDNTTVGCEYFGCHSAQNSFKVSHGGLFYIPIKYHVSAADSEPGIGVNWQTYWLAVNASIADAAWALATPYFPSGGINVSDATAPSSLIGHYTEGGIEAGVIVRNRCTVNGGYAAIRSPWHGELRGAVVTGGGGSGTPTVYPFVGQTTPGNSGSDYGGSWGALDAYTSGRILQFGDARDDGSNGPSAVRFLWNDIRKRYEYQDASNAGRAMFGFTGTGYGGTGFGSITQAYPWANGLVVADGGTVANTVTRIRAATSFAAITDAAYGAPVRGDIWFYTQPTAGGKVGAVCTTAGTIGSSAVIHEFGQVNVPSVSTQSGTAYTAVLGDAGTYIRFTNAGAVTFTVPPNSSVPFPVGTTIELEQSGGGTVTVAPGAGVTVDSRGGVLSTAGQHAVAALKKVATDMWTLTGDIA